MKMKKKLSKTALLLGVLLLATLGHADLGTELIGYWHMDDSPVDASNSTIIASAGLDATLVDAETGDRSVSGIITNAIQFWKTGGHHAYADMGSGYGPANRNYTVNFWWNSGSSAGGLMNDGNWGSTVSGLSLHLIGSGNIYARFNDGTSNNDLTVVTGASLGTWYMLTMTVDRDTDTLTLYHNGGQASGSASIAGYGSLAGAAGSTYFGSVVAGNTGVAASSSYTALDEIAVWNRVLTSAEIAELYNGGAPSTITVPPPVDLTVGLTGYWQMNDNPVNALNSNVVAIIGSDAALNDVETGNRSVAGKIDNAVKFWPETVGNHAYADMGREYAGGTNSYTVNFWWNSGSSTIGLMNNGNWGSTVTGLSLSLTGRNIYARFRSWDDNDDITVITGASLGTWYMLTLTVDRDTDTITLYHNGGEASGSASIAGWGSLDGAGDAESKTYFGAVVSENTGVPTLATYMTLDEIAIWDRVLTTNEISALYFGGVGSEIGFTDIDGVPTSWILNYWASTNAYVATDDDDLDKLVNRDEYFADTVPTDAASVLKLLNVSLGSMTATVEYQNGGPDADVYIDARPDLAISDWTPFATNAAPGSTTNTAVHWTTGTENFYRLRAVRP